MDREERSQVDGRDDAKKRAGMRSVLVSGGRQGCWLCYTGKVRRDDDVAAQSVLSYGLRAGQQE